MTWLFLFAYACSGLAGLVYEVSWTRLLTLYIGHTTAAASTVVAAFLGGLALGAGGGGVVALRLTPRRSLRAYILLELIVAVAALVLPYELAALTPLLKWSYRNGDPGLLFPAIRLLSCLLMVFVPATALGATFPMAIRWLANTSDDPARSTGSLYAINTSGAAAGALLAGFTLIPAIGLAGTTRVGVAASALAAIGVWALVQIDVQSDRTRHEPPPTTAAPARLSNRPHKGRNRVGRRSALPGGEVPRVPEPRWLAAAVLGLSGFAALMHEIVWTRILSLLLGPTIYAFAATLAAVIGGMACGSGVGTWVAGRTKRPAVWLAVGLAGAAVTASWTCSMAGGQIPRLVAQQMATSPNVLDQFLRQGTLLTAALILPTAFCLGSAFPLALASVSDPSPRAVARDSPLDSARDRGSSAGQFGLVYATNTLGAVTGSLAAGFVFIPLLGLQSTLRLVSGSLIVSVLVVVAWARLSRTARVAGLVATAVATTLVAVSPSWDRELLSSGAYLYAPYVPKDLDLETLLKAGTLLYYREGSASTVSVKRLTGTTTLAIDGKVDASNRSDMLTQKLLAHLPLLLHENPREVGVIGLGSGVTVGAALRHPIARADVIEISPEVVEASRFFDEENHHALADPRTHLIVGDGRSHLLLSDRQYDVIISEPSNPWIAGVAALFTREFFVAARDRLAPGGIICQWAHTYNISPGDLRSIVATFTSVFPNGTLWLVGADDVLLVASGEPARDRSVASARDRTLDVATDGSPDSARERSLDGTGRGPLNRSLDSRLANIARNWTRSGVADDLKDVAAVEPFSLWSLFAGGPDELSRFSAGAAILTDDRMTLEFSGPRALHRSSAGDNGAALLALLGAADGPPVVRQAKASAGAAQWRNRGAMMAKSDAHGRAYDDYVRALIIDPSDAVALERFGREAVLSGRVSEALSWLKGLTGNRTQMPDALVATSKLLAANGLVADAVETARQALDILPGQVSAVEQLASLFADTGDTAQLDTTVATLREMAPQRGSTYYYAAVAAFLHDQVDQAVQLAERAISLDPGFAPVYDLLGAAYTRQSQLPQARDAFLASLRLDAHDSTAYTNLGLIELASANHPAAARYFAEALGLAPNSTVAREGLARTR